MIDTPDQITPDGLRQEAANLRYTGRAHGADVMEWAAKHIAELEAQKSTAYKEVEIQCRKVVEAEARLDAVAKWLDDEWTLTEQQRQGCLKAVEQEDG